MIDPVWELARDAYTRASEASLLLEWDAEIPSFDEVHREARKASAFVRAPHIASRGLTGTAS